MRRGFTLIELLVVIAIVGLLSSVVISGVNSARAKARDTLRAQHIRQMQNALELYRSFNGSYPSSLNCDAAGPTPSPNNHWCHSHKASWNTLQTALDPYMTLPHDPQEATAVAGAWATTQHNYSYHSLYSSCPDGQWYALVFKRENDIGTHGGIPMCDGTTIFGDSYVNSGTYTVGVGRDFVQ
jgi:type II secretion system protein G